MEPITINIKGGSFIEEGRSIDFVCSAASNLAAVNVTWYDSNDKLLASSNTRVTLTLDSITRNHSGRYTCKARAGGFIEIKTKTVNVKVICKLLLYFYQFRDRFFFCFYQISNILNWHQVKGLYLLLNDIYKMLA